MASSQPALRVVHCAARRRSGSTPRGALWALGSASAALPNGLGYFPVPTLNLPVWRWGWRFFVGVAQAGLPLGHCATGLL
jgi:hypothetical protein